MALPFMAKRFSLDDRTIGSPVDWLQELDELRSGTRPDETLWHDLTESLHAFGLWKEGTSYSPAAAERLFDLLKDAETRAQHEFHQAEQALQTWPEASVPGSISEWPTSLRFPKMTEKAGLPATPLCEVLCATCLGSLRTTT